MSVFGYIFWSLAAVLAAAFALCVGFWFVLSTRRLVTTLMDRAVQRGEARLHAAIGRAAQRHRPDCACDPCWDRHCERLVDSFDWDAAEDDFLRRHK